MLFDLLLIYISVACAVSVVFNIWLLIILRNKKKENSGTLHLLEDPEDGSTYAYLTLSKEMSEVKRQRYVRLNVQVESARK